METQNYLVVITISYSAVKRSYNIEVLGLVLNADFSHLYDVL